jgi:hypothetical protein
VSSLNRRLRALEDGGGRCPACGIDPNRPPVYRVSWDEPGPPEVSSPPCSRCGRRRRVVVDFDGIFDGADEAADGAAG